MGLYRLIDNEIQPVKETGFAREGLRERDDLRRYLRDAIEVVAPDTIRLLRDTHFTGT